MHQLTARRSCSATDSSVDQLLYELLNPFHDDLYRIRAEVDTESRVTQTISDKISSPNNHLSVISILSLHLISTPSSVLFTNLHKAQGILHSFNNHANGSLQCYQCPIMSKIRVITVKTVSNRRRLTKCSDLTKAQRHRQLKLLNQHVTDAAEHKSQFTQ